MWVGRRSRLPVVSASSVIIENTRIKKSKVRVGQGRQMEGKKER